MVEALRAPNIFAIQRSCVPHVWVGVGKPVQIEKEVGSETNVRERKEIQRVENGVKTKRKGGREHKKEREREKERE